MKKNLIIVVAASVVTSVASMFALQSFFNASPSFLHKDAQVPIITTSNTSAGSMGYIDFSEAAERAVPAVVQISTLVEGRQVIARDPFNPFAGSGRVYKMPNQVGSGSGVIISKDGYIVTNYHVIQNASQVQVTFNNRDVQVAKVIGTDPSMDLALLKIDGNDYPFLSFGDSDALKLGQWVLAVGFPLNLETTVTAGIVSAKSRSIGINQRNSHNAIESFIQTDAAVNPGNSGGALIDANGVLVGINTAIASPTGAYAGYSYAIPSNLVIKAVQDLKTHGKVLRGYLGVELVDLDKVNPNHIEQFGLTTEEFRHSKGVLVHNVVENGSADNAGIKKGDFIIGINGKNVYSSPQLMEGIAQLSPGETVEVQISRKGKVSSSKLTLQGEEELIAAAKQARSKSSAAAKSTANARDSNTPINLQSLGIKYKELSKDEAQRLNISGGIQITDITEGVIKSNTNIRPGFIIFNLNEEEVTKEEDVRKAIRKSNRSVEIAGKYPNQNGIHYYNIQK